MQRWTISNTKIKEIFSTYTSIFCKCRMPLVCFHKPSPELRYLGRDLCFYSEQSTRRWLQGPPRSIRYKSFRVHQDRLITNRSGSTKIDPLQIVQGTPRSIHYKSFRVHQDRSVTNRSGYTKIDPLQIVQGTPRSIRYKSFRVHQDRSVTNRSGSTKIDPLQIVQGTPRLINYEYKSLTPRASWSSQPSKYGATHEYSKPHVQSVPSTRTSLCIRKTAAAIIRQSWQLKFVGR